MAQKNPVIKQFQHFPELTVILRNRTSSLVG